jgi:hypothetical protein
VPWRGPEVKGEYPTLGYAVADWIEANCVIPDGELQGEPYKLTDEMLLFLLKYYRLKDGRGIRRAAPVGGVLPPRRAAHAAAEVGQGPVRGGHRPR